MPSYQRLSDPNIMSVSCHSLTRISWNLVAPYWWIIKWVSSDVTLITSNLTNGIPFLHIRTYTNSPILCFSWYGAWHASLSNAKGPVHPIIRLVLILGSCCCRFSQRWYRSVGNGHETRESTPRIICRYWRTRIADHGNQGDKWSIWLQKFTNYFYEEIVCVI